MFYESQMAQVLEAKLASEKTRLAYAISDNAPLVLTQDYTREIKRIERQLSKVKKVIA